METDARLNNTPETVKKLVPHASIVQQSRSRRSLLHFIGQFSKTLFGTATIEDVNVLAKHINALTKRTAHIAHALVQHNDHLSSFMAQMNKRMDTLMAGIKENNLAIQYIHSQVTRTSQSLQAAFEEMTMLLVNQMQTSSKLNHQLDELKLGIVDLANGKLSPLILSLDTIQSTLNDIQSILGKKYPGFHVSVKSASEMYQQSKFLYLKNNSVLCITIKVPISNSDSALDLFKIKTLPVPVNDKSKHATQLLDLPDHFAMSSNQQFYMHITAAQLSTCHGSAHKYCHWNYPLQPVTKDSCSLALFSNNKENIQTFCNFRFVHDVIRPNIIELTDNQVVLFDSPILSMECSTRHQMIKGCNFCIFDLPCQCSLSTQDFYLPQRLLSCTNYSNNTVTKLHPVNLILLQKFFDNDKFEHVFADSIFQNPVNISVPTFSLFEHKMSNILANDEKDHLNLTKMVEIAKNDQVVFQTLAEPILDGHVTIPTTWPDTNGIIAISALTFASIFTFISIYMFFKLRTLAATVMVLQQCQQIKAMATDLPSFIYTRRPVPPEPSFTISIPLSWEHAIFAFVFLNTVALIIILVRYSKPKRAPRLLLEITIRHHCVFVHLMKLPLCPSHSNIKVPETVSDLQIIGSWYAPKLQVSWSTFTVQNTITDKTFDVPKYLSLNVFQARKLKRILKTPFFVHMHAEHNGYLTHISLAKD